MGNCQSFPSANGRTHRFARKAKSIFKKDSANSQFEYASIQNDIPIELGIDGAHNAKPPRCIARHRQRIDDPWDTSIHINPRYGRGFRRRQRHDGCRAECSGLHRCASPPRPGPSYIPVIYQCPNGCGHPHRQGSTEPRPIQDFWRDIYRHDPFCPHQDQDFNQSPSIQQKMERAISKLCRLTLDSSSPLSSRHMCQTSDTNSSTKAVKSIPTTASHSQQQSDDPFQPPVKTPSINITEADSGIAQQLVLQSSTVIDNTSNSKDSLYIETTLPPSSPPPRSPRRVFKEDPADSSIFIDDKGKGPVSKDASHATRQVVQFVKLSKRAIKGEIEPEELKKCHSV